MEQTNFLLDVRDYHQFLLKDGVAFGQLVGQIEDDFPRVDDSRIIVILDINDHLRVASTKRSSQEKVHTIANKFSVIFTGKEVSLAHLKRQARFLPTGVNQLIYLTCVGERNLKLEVR